MSEINKKPILSPLVEFQTEVDILQELTRNYHVTDLPINSLCIDRITSKKYDCTKPIFTITERMVLKILLRKAIFSFRKSWQCDFLRRFYVWRRENFEKDGQNAEKCLVYFDNLVLMVKKYGLLTTELIEEIKSLNKSLKLIRKNIKKWKTLNTKNNE
jgi:hypothetical protein